MPVQAEAEAEAQGAGEVEGEGGATRGVRGRQGGGRGEARGRQGGGKGEAGERQGEAGEEGGTGEAAGRVGPDGRCLEGVLLACALALVPLLHHETKLRVRVDPVARLRVDQAHLGVAELVGE